MQTSEGNTGYCHSNAYLSFFLSTMVFSRQFSFILSLKKYIENDIALSYVGLINSHPKNSPCWHRFIHVNEEIPEMWSKNWVG